MAILTQRHGVSRGWGKLRNQKPRQKLWRCSSQGARDGRTEYKFVKMLVKFRGNSCFVGNNIPASFCSLTEPYSKLSLILTTSFQFYYKNRHFHVSFPVTLLQLIEWHSDLVSKFDPRLPGFFPSSLSRLETGDNCHLWLP